MEENQNAFKDHGANALALIDFIRAEIDEAQIYNANHFAKGAGAEIYKDKSEITKHALESGKIFVGPSLDRMQEIDLSNPGARKALSDKIEKTDLAKYDKGYDENLANEKDNAASVAILLNRIDLAIGQLAAEIAHLDKSKAELFAESAKKLGRRQDSSSALSLAYMNMKQKI
jgi:hypothetical protein